MRHLFLDGLCTKGAPAHTQKELIRGGVLSERARIRGHYGPLCPKLVAAKSGSTQKELIGEGVKASERGSGGTMAPCAQPLFSR